MHTWQQDLPQSLPLTYGSCMLGLPWPCAELWWTRNSCGEGQERSAKEKKGETLVQKKDFFLKRLSSLVG